MRKRDDSGSGLRAGFVRGDGLSHAAANKPEPKPEEEKLEKEQSSAKKTKSEKAEKPETEKIIAPPADEAEGPTVTMQGVSGKKITSVVVRARRPKKTADEEAAEADKASAGEAPAAAETAAAAAKAPAAAEKTATPETPAAAPVPAAPAKTDKPAAEKPADISAPAAAPAVAATTESVPAAKAPAAKTEPAAAQAPAAQAPAAQAPATQAPAAQSQAPAAQAQAPAARSADAPAARQPAPTQGDRPQSAQGQRPQQGRTQQGQRPYGDRPQGQRSFGDRPQGDRPQGQGQRPYGDRPQQGQRPYGDRPQQGQRPYGDRPQSDRPQGDRPQGDRPYSGAPRQQGSRPYSGTPRPQGDRPAYNSGRPQGGQRPARPVDPLSEAVSELQRPGFANRGGVDRKRTDDKRQPRREQPKPGMENPRDKHHKLKEQAAVISGEGVSKALKDETLLDTLYNPAGGRGRGRRGGRRGAQQQRSAPVVRAVLTNVKLPESLTVKEFAEAIKKTSADVIKRLIKLGVMATVNQEIDFDTAALIAEEYGITAEKLVTVTAEEKLFDDSEDDVSKLKPRPPVVVVMGHVDHGKTSILDRFRSANVVSGEAGGITQHIGAYTVCAKDREITFLDTPGHEAFTTMRARGAQVTDIAILVVAADDGVMPQTVEAINHARAADTEIIVAINKIDKEGANLDRVKQELSKYELIPEEWGGTTVMVPVSAKTGQGIDELLEMVLLTADVMELKADPDRQAKGTVIEAKLDKNRGAVATVLVQRGTLRMGDTLVAGATFGRVRAMIDDKGKNVKKAGPSIPVEILGLPEVPEAGDIFYVVTDEKEARALADRRRSDSREQQLRTSSRMSLENLYSQMATGEVKDLNIIVKADVQGSVEAVIQSLEKLNNAGEEVRVNVIHGGVGAITESDIRLADVSNAIVIGFNVRPAANVIDMAADTGVDMRMYRVIYNAIEDIEAAMKGMLAPEFKEVVTGHAEIRQTFKASGVGTIGGAYVTDGKIVRNTDIRVVRDGIVIHEGKLSSLKRFKDDVREVAAGYECGLSVERFNDIKEGDIIEAFEMKQIERS
ncbi:MAG: translation initiation factor IF-2 [Saccharofermentanales bacterium]